MIRAIALCAVIIVMIAVPASLASGPFASVEAGQKATYQLTLTGNITDTLSFTVSSYSPSSLQFSVQQDESGSLSVVNASASSIFTAFPVVVSDNASAMLPEILHSPVNGYGFQGALMKNSNETLSSGNGTPVTVPAGTYDAVEFTANGYAAGNGTYTYGNVTALIDSGTGLILSLSIHIVNNGTQLNSFARLTGTNAAKKAVSGTNVPLLVAGAGISVVAVLLSLAIIIRKKK